MDLPHEELTGQIIGAAIEVHKALGPGFVEAIYENALAIELRARNIPFQRQLSVSILYRGAEVGLHRLAKPTVETKRVIASADWPSR